MSQWKGRTEERRGTIQKTCASWWSTHRETNQIWLVFFPRVDGNKFRKARHRFIGTSHFDMTWTPAGLREVPKCEMFSVCNLEAALLHSLEHCEGNPASQNNSETSSARKSPVPELEGISNGGFVLYTAPTQTSSWVSCDSKSVHLFFLPPREHVPNMLIYWWMPTYSTAPEWDFFFSRDLWLYTPDAFFNNSHKKMYILWTADLARVFSHNMAAEYHGAVRLRLTFLNFPTKKHHPVVMGVRNVHQVSNNSSNNGWQADKISAPRVVRQMRCKL